MKLIRPLSLFVWLLLACANLRAHQFWLEPSGYRPGVGTTIQVGVRIGADFPGDSFARTPGHIQLFEIITGDKVLPVGGIPYRSPAGRATVTASGTHVIRYDSLPSYAEIDAETFQAYLEEEGLEEAMRIREEKNATALPGRERFSRCAKLLILAGNEQTILKDSYVGQILEVVMMSPLDLNDSSGEAEFEIRWQDNPMPDILVRADNPDFSDGPVFKKTDAQGRVKFDVPIGGQWLISTVRIMEIDDDPKAEWESFWASLTFKLPESESAPTTE